MINEIGTGISQKMTGQAEQDERKRIMEAYELRLRKMRCGTHSLGPEFKTVKSDG